MTDSDNLHVCPRCRDRETTDAICWACRQQELIDNESWLDEDDAEEVFVYGEAEPDDNEYDMDDTDAMFALWDPYPAPWFDGNPGPDDENEPNGRYIGPGSEVLP